MAWTQTYPRTARAVGSFVKLNVFLFVFSMLITVWMLLALGTVGFAGISFPEFVSMVARQYAMIWVSFGAILYFSFCYSPLVYVIHAWLVWSIMPERIDALAAALCDGVVNQAIPIDPSTTTYPGPYVLDGDIAYRLYENYEIWDGECSYETGIFGLNGGPNGQEFYIDFKGSDSGHMQFRHSFEFSLPWNLWNTQVFYNNGVHPLRLRDSARLPVRQRRVSPGS